MSKTAPNSDNKTERFETTCFLRILRFTIVKPMILTIGGSIFEANIDRNTMQKQTCNAKPTRDPFFITEGSILVPFWLPKRRPNRSNIEEKTMRKTVAKKGQQDREKGGQNDDPGVPTLIGGCSRSIQDEGWNRPGSPGQPTGQPTVKDYQVKKSSQPTTTTPWARPGEF